jgi:hypothetical protein
MRILLTIAHFFRAEEGSNHSSTDAHRRDQRAQAVRDEELALQVAAEELADVQTASPAFTDAAAKVNSKSLPSVALQAAALHQAATDSEHTFGFEGEEVIITQ